MVVAIGRSSNSHADGAVALGSAARAQGADAISLGHNAGGNWAGNYNGDPGHRYGAINLGAYTHAAGPMSIAIGHRVVAPTNHFVLGSGSAQTSVMLSGVFGSYLALPNGQQFRQIASAAQTSDLTQWQNSAGTNVAAMTPSGVLNTYGVVASGNISVTSESSTPLAVQGQDTGNSSFELKAGTGATSNQAILKLQSGNTGNVRIYLGDTDDPDVGQIRYNHSNEKLSIRNNAADRFIIGSDGRTGFGTSAVTPSVGYIDVVAHSGTVMCSGVRGHLETKSAAANIYFDIDQSTAHHVVLGSAANNLHANNTRVGDRFLIRLQQDGTGSRTVTAWFNHIKWAGGSAPTLTTTAAKADVFGFLAASGDGSNIWYDGFVVGQNI